MSQLRNDLCNRIKDRHDLWIHDTIDLYEMAKLRPHQCANDMLAVMTFRIAWLLVAYDADMDTFVKALRQSVEHHREAEQ